MPYQRNVVLRGGNQIKVIDFDVTSIPNNHVIGV